MTKIQTWIQFEERQPAGLIAFKITIGTWLFQTWKLMEKIEIGRRCLALGDIQFMQNAVDVIFDGADFDGAPLHDLLIAKSLADQN
jgi:hypothetical protein